MSMKKPLKIGDRIIPGEDIAGLECVFATYSSNKYTGSDLLTVKENVHLKSGEVIPNVRLFKDHKWPFWVTREGHRKHKEKKEWEKMERLQRYESTRLNLTKAIGRALNTNGQLPLRALSSSPYLYGTDVKPTALIKDKYQKRWPEAKTITHRVASLDTETDVLHKTNNIIINNITFGNKSYTAVTKSFARGIPDFAEKCKALARELIPDVLDRHNLDWMIDIVDTPGRTVVDVIDKAHEWRPDFINIWNMDFDIPVMEKALLDEKYNPAYIFSDPSVPDEFKFFRYKQGDPIKVNQKGDKTALHFADRWHVCTTPASFYFIDSMCLYKRIRTAGGNLSSYALDAILAHEGLPPKLKIKELEHLNLDSTAWHVEMQKNWPIHYVVYNLIDNIRTLELDQKIGDICRAFPALCGISDFADFNKNPRRIVDDLHFIVQESNMVIGSTPADIAKDPLNKYVIGIDDWIITLPSQMIDSGISLFHDAPLLRTMIYLYLADLDISSTYPNAQDILNISKRTTLYETCRIQGFTEKEQRYFGLTLTGGRSSALELGIRYHGMPSPEQLLEAYRNRKNKQ